MVNRKEQHQIRSMTNDFGYRSKRIAFTSPNCYLSRKYPSCHGDNLSTEPFAPLNWCQLSASLHSSLASTPGYGSDFIRGDLAQKS
ncbi:hypothetical protein P7K49_000624 [Saguinus oedipus]|uniref:Uncharacterized protein n=1 Tax=Saguinus oedipus TaxID=9490 RepID=A0ABQ9WC83_SAGOE|nr:hypothetical protein P7K49_000624 [Saguinus oedipus]